jgi:hypothetical protein
MKKKKRININPDTKAKNYLVSNWQCVYKDSDDEKLGIPPLFEFKFVMQNIDFDRLNGCPNIVINYEIKDDILKFNPSHQGK